MSALVGKDDYDSSAAAWADGPARVYARLAAAMLDHAPVPLVGADVLDVGAGTAVASDEALARGARTAVASDVALEMLRRRTPSLPAVAADAARLPFGDQSFDLVVGGFCLGHLPDPARALAEWRRVAPAALATTFAPGDPHPAKVAVDTAVQRFGFVVPAWYQRLKDDLEPQVEDPRLLAGLARSAGFRRVVVTRVTVDVALNTPREIAAWRLGMAHLAPFLGSLPPGRRREVRLAAETAVTGLAPVLVDLQVLSAS